MIRRTATDVQGMKRSTSMSEGDIKDETFESLIKSWANDENRSNTWIHELKMREIDSLESLKVASGGSGWQDFLDSFPKCSLLKAYLEKWQKEEKKERKTEQKEHPLLRALNIQLKNIGPSQKLPEQKLLNEPDGSNDTPLRAFVNREKEIALALGIFSHSRKTKGYAYKQNLLVCSQMFDQGKTRFGRELTHPNVYENLKKVDHSSVEKFKDTIELLKTTEYILIDVSLMMPLVKPEQVGMQAWINICIICSILRVRGVDAGELVDACVSNPSWITGTVVLLLEALNSNVFLHFDELDAISNSRVDEEAFYDFWFYLRSFLCDYFVFCTAREAWFRRVLKKKIPTKSPIRVVRVVLRTLSTEYIKQIIEQSPAQDKTMRAQNRTLRDELDIDSDDVFIALSQQIEDVSGGIPRLIDYALNSLCKDKVGEKISIQTISKLFCKTSLVYKSLLETPDVGYLLQELKQPREFTVLPVLIWFGYTQAAVDINESVTLFVKKYITSEMADLYRLYVGNVGEDRIQLKLPRCFRDAIEGGIVSALGALFPQIKTGSQWKTFENFVHCFLASLMKVSETRSQKTTFASICSKLTHSYAEELCFSTQSELNRIIFKGKLSKDNAHYQYETIMNDVPLGGTALVSFEPMSHSPDHLIVFRGAQDVVLVGFQDKLWKKSNCATKKLLEEEVAKFQLCRESCVAKKAIFIVLASFWKGELEADAGRLLTREDFGFIPVDMQVIVLTSASQVSDFLFDEKLAFAIIDRLDSH